MRLSIWAGVQVGMSQWARSPSWLLPRSPPLLWSLSWLLPLWSRSASVAVRVPLGAVRSPARVRARVDLPAPLGPSTLRCSPACRVRLMPLRSMGRSVGAGAGVSPRRLMVRRRARRCLGVGCARVMLRFSARSSASPCSLLQSFCGARGT